MNSRERVLAAIAHIQPDQVPVDLGSTPSSGISAIAYSNLLKAIGRTDLPVQIYDVVQQLAQPDMSIIDRFGVDVLISDVRLIRKRKIGTKQSWPMEIKPFIRFISIR